MSRVIAILEQSKLKPDELLRVIERGATVVRYPYVISAVVASFSLESRAVLIERPNQRYTKAIPYLLFTLLFGWWGVPWGPIFTAKALWSLIQGGEDITDSIRDELVSQLVGVE